MSEVQRYLLCKELPRLSCGFYFQCAQDIVEAYIADAEAFVAISEEVRKEYEVVRQHYENLTPQVRRVMDRLLPWILQLRLQYDDVCADTILAFYAHSSPRVTIDELLFQPN